MKRQLNDEERKFTEKGLKLMQKELEKHREERDVYECSLLFIGQKREYEDKVRPFNRMEENKQWHSKIGLETAKINEVQKSIKESETQLKEGVEQKEVKGV